MLNKNDILVDVAALIKASKPEILTVWMLEPNVVSIFGKHHISRNKFKSLFASKIVDYFIGVLDGSQKIGACPVMNKFIDYMYDKEISVKEIFQICMAFRYSTLHQLNSDSELFVQGTQLEERLYEVFDENLSGVLDYYSLLHLNREVQVQHEEYTDTYSKQLQSILNLQDNMILTVKGSYITIANRSFLQMLAVDDIDEFQVKYPDNWNFIKTVEHFCDLFEKRDYLAWLEKVADSNEQTTTVTFVNETLQESRSYHAKVMRISEKEKNDFAVTISALSDCDEKIDELSHFVYTDPLTNLYNRRKFDEAINALVEQYHNAKLPFALIVMDLDDLNRINQMHGRERGDEILKEIGHAVDDKFGSLGIFARIDGDRFGLVLKGKNLEEGDKIAQDMLLLTRAHVFDGNIEPKCNFAVLHCQKRDTQVSMLERADTLIKDIIKSRSNAIKNDQALIQEEQERRKQEASFLISCIELKAADKSLDIVSYYQEIPIQSKSKIIKVQRGVLTLTVRRISINAVYKGSYIYIRSPEDKKSIKALVTDINNDNYTISVQNFNFIKHSPLDRKSIHVKVEEDLFCFVKMDDTQIKGKVLSISADTIMIALAHVYGVDMDNKIFVDTTLNVEGREEHLQITGSIIKISEIDDGFKLIIAVDKNSKADKIIVPYVASKQLEIIKTLQHSSQ